MLSLARPSMRPSALAFPPLLRSSAVAACLLPLALTESRLSWFCCPAPLLPQVLTPEDSNMLVQRGGVLVFERGECALSLLPVPFPSCAYAFLAPQWWRMTNETRRRTGSLSALVPFLLRPGSSSATTTRASSATPSPSALPSAPCRRALPAC